MSLNVQVRSMATLAGVALVLVCGASRLRASTFADYEHRVSSAATMLEQAAGASEDESIRDPNQFVAVNLARVRQDLPAKESVLLDGQTIEIDNSWLHRALDEYNAASQSRSLILTRAAERLRALSERLNEVRSGQMLSDKDADKGRLAEILRRPEYIQTAPESSALERLVDRFLRWLGRLFPRTRPLQPGASPLISLIARILVVGMSIAAIAFLIWKFGPRFIQGRRKKKPKREARIVLGERLEPDQTAADLLAQAEDLAQRGDLRAAIRKAYIALLCELGDRKLISLAQHKTNRDYLNSVRDKPSLHGSLRKLTSSFELHWYGFVPAGVADWNQFREGYINALRIGPAA